MSKHSFRAMLARIIYPEIFKEIESVKDKKEEYVLSQLEYKRAYEDAVKKQNSLLEENKELVAKITEIDELSDTDLELYCKSAFKQVPLFAYKDKGVFKDLRYPMYMNELICPKNYLADAMRKELGVKSKDFKSWVLRVGKYVDKRLKWTSDADTSGKLDTWQDFYAVALSPKDDCENHAGLASSIEPEIGIGVGYCGKTYHAWNVFMYKGELWCLETNSVYDYNRNARVFKYKDQDHYKLDWIFTQNKTFECKAKPTEFGVREK
jgi:hypothetical protein